MVGCSVGDDGEGPLRKYGFGSLTINNLLTSAVINNYHNLYYAS